MGVYDKQEIDIFHEQHDENFKRFVLLNNGYKLRDVRIVKTNLWNLLLKNEYSGTSYGP